MKDFTEQTKDLPCPKCGSMMFISDECKTSNPPIYAAKCECGTKVSPVWGMPGGKFTFSFSEAFASSP